DRILPIAVAGGCDCSERAEPATWHAGRRPGGRELRRLHICLGPHSCGFGGSLWMVRTMGVMMLPEPPPGPDDQPAPRPASGDENRSELADMIETALHVQLRDHLRQVEKLVVGASRRANLRGELENVIPAWLRPTPGEPRWPVTTAVLAAI